MLRFCGGLGVYATEPQDFSLLALHLSFEVNVGSTIRLLAATVTVGIGALYSIVAIRHCVRARRWLSRHERWSRTQEGCCSQCGYNLRGHVSGACPECGRDIETPLPPEQAPAAPSLIDKQPRWVPLTVLLIMALTFFILPHFPYDPSGCM